MGILPLTTDRLTLRMMREADAPTLAAYRDDPAVARYQDWELPYSVAHARRMLATQHHLDDVTPGAWVQLAIERDGAVVGDVAVGLDDQGRTATIGYTLAPAHHGHGYASEAVTAVVDELFARGGIRRITASVDPQNFASMRVIEPLGFRHEGTAIAAVDVRGEWVDDMNFALLADERATWVAREGAPVGVVELVEITNENLAAVRNVQTHRFQEEFVASVPKSLAQALIPPPKAIPWFRAIAADGEIVGFVMVSAVHEHEPEPYLWRLNVDRAHQRRGIGRLAIHRLVEMYRADGHAGLKVSWIDGPGGPRRFYERLGFVELGLTDEGEVEGRLAL